MNKPTAQAELLRETRLAKGISLETLHEATKIPMDVLRAIEEGYKVRTLSPFYYRGFLKIYAQYVGVDLSVLPKTEIEEKPKEGLAIASFSETWSEKMKFVFPVYRRRQIFKVLVILLAGWLLIRLGGFIWARMHTKRAAKSGLEQTITPPRTEGLPPKTVAVPRPRGGNNLTAAVKPVDPEPKHQSQVVPPREAPAAAAVPLAASVEPRKKSIILTVRAKKNTWLQVKVDQEVVFQSILKKGMAETWSAHTSIEISGKSITQLEYEFNGKLIGALGRGDRLANTVIVTKDGLSVKR